MINCDLGDKSGEETRCSCTEEEIAAGHRHRCPAGPPAYRAVGPWADLTPEEIEATWRDERSSNPEGHQ
ncbi:MAG TPA: hypothetical protein VGD73_28745 [Pseudonocardia sp.]|jgi:hypothetical protein|uniref:hypothetical protein n=1 Tax=Pseudonocardia sp. TaxID=60912 RepID=UPI002ED9FE79